VQRSGQPAGSDDLVADDQLKEQERLFQTAMNDDFNTALALNHLFRYISQLLPRLDPTPTLGHQRAADILGFLQRAGTILFGDLYDQEVTQPPTFAADKLVQLILAERESMRRNKQYDQADILRKELHDIGIEVTDTPTGPVWTPILAEPGKSANDTQDANTTSRKAK
jgi:cysteinyl-tRNA synthetase